MLKQVTFILLLFIAVPSMAQVGGSSSFRFLDVPVNARLAGIGGMNVSLADNDVNMFFQNPGALNDQMEKRLSINYLPYFAGIHTTTLAYVTNIGGNTWGFGVHYMDYGVMDKRLEDGTDAGTFSARDYAFIASRSHTIDNISIGLNLKFVGSHFGASNAFGVLFDLGGVFQHPEKDFSVGMVFRNAGFAFSSYTPGTQLAMPFDARLGLTYKPEHMPFRFSVTVHNLHRPDIVYLDPNAPTATDLEGNEIKPRKTVFDMVARHFTFGGEFLLSDNFNIRVGYNHMMRREMRLPDRTGPAGFSVGFMMRVKTFEFAYSKAFYHLAGGTDNLTITSDLGAFVKRKDRKITD
ncbi:type IX secretion system protein PorQ [Cytophagaceae bacterium ABcell3]|nr:type IX secretion system protein PorQ [Cytophagaceae bacterium ABcell3]